MVHSCKYCGELIYVWHNGKQVPYRTGPKAKAVTCGRCLARGVLRKDSLEERRKQLVELLREPIQNLKHFRKKMGITQIELSEILEVDQSIISRVEKGLKPMPDGWVKKIKGHITLSTIA